MTRWRRLCVDVDESGEVIGGSVEFYSDRKADAETIAVMARSDWTGLTPEEVLDVELGLGWLQPALPFWWASKDASG